jgi:hypothetical protein
MATNETERNEHDAGEPDRVLASEAAPPAPQPESAPSLLQAPAAQPAPEPVAEPDPAERLREEYAEIASLAAQAINLASRRCRDAMRRSRGRPSPIHHSPLAARRATSVIAAAASTSCRRQPDCGVPGRAPRRLTPSSLIIAGARQCQPSPVPTLGDCSSKLNANYCRETAARSAPTMRWVPCSANHRLKNRLAGRPVVGGWQGAS